MHDIKKGPEKRYKGSKAKLIHLPHKTFNLLTIIADKKNLSLKKYIELLCVHQAKFEADQFLKNHNEE